MKLKFRPSNSSESSPDSPNTNPSGNPVPPEETKGVGKGMIIISLILALGMMTIFFQSQIDKQANPNQQVNSSQNAQGQTIVILQRNRSGHYVSNGNINQREVTFLLDTGATDVAIPIKMINYLGLDKGRKIRLSTANGTTIGYQTTIRQITIGQIVLYNIKAVLTPNLDDILLGMSALKQLEFTQKGNQLILKQ